MFEIIRPMDRTAFLENWAANERPDDDVSLLNLKNHREHQEQKYFIVSLTEEGFNSLILPYHAHGKVNVSRDGETLQSVVSKYTSNIRVGNEDCWQRICWIRKAITDEFRKSGNIFPATKMPFVSNSPEFAVPGHYTQRDFPALYTGSFHRFVAIGMWMEENHSYQPIQLYYCAL